MTDMSKIVYNSVFADCKKTLKEAEALKARFKKELIEAIKTTAKGLHGNEHSTVYFGENEDIFFDNYLCRNMIVDAVRINNANDIILHEQDSRGDWWWIRHDDDGVTDFAELMNALVNNIDADTTDEETDED